MTSNVFFSSSISSYIFDRIERLVRYDDVKRRGQTDVFRGEMIKAVNNEIGDSRLWRDIFEHLPDNGEMNVTIKLLPWGPQKEDDWSVDLHF